MVSNALHVIQLQVFSTLPLIFLHVRHHGCLDGIAIHVELRVREERLNQAEGTLDDVR